MEAVEIYYFINLVFNTKYMLKMLFSNFDYTETKTGGK